MISLTVSVILMVAVFIVLSIKTNKVFSSWHIIAFLPLLINLFQLFTIVPANNVGVLYSPFSGVCETTLPEGIHAKGFFDNIYLISTEVQSKKVEGLSGQTKDSQYIKIVLDVKYRINSEQAFNIFRQYKNIKNVDADLIAPTVQRSIEAVTTNYNIIEILGSARNTVYLEIEADLKNRFSASGIDLVLFTLVDTDAGDAIEQAIQNEAVAKKAVETAEQERLKAQIEAQKRVVEAQADKDKASVEAETKLIGAQAEADAKLIYAKSNAEAYKVMNEYLTQEALDKMWVEKWNGVLPTVVTGGDGMMLDMGNIVN